MPRSPTRPTMARPLSAPRSTARKLAAVAMSVGLRPAGGDALAPRLDARLRLAAVEVGAQRIGGEPAGFVPAGQHGADVGVVCVLEQAVGGDDVAARLR